MRIVSIEFLMDPDFGDAIPPLTTGTVQLDCDVNTLVGANDSGKSTALAAISSSASYEYFNDAGDYGATMRLSDYEADELIRRAILDVSLNDFKGALGQLEFSNPGDVNRSLKAARPTTRAELADFLRAQLDGDSLDEKTRALIDAIPEIQLADPGYETVAIYTDRKNPDDPDLPAVVIELLSNNLRDLFEPEVLDLPSDTDELTATLLSLIDNAVVLADPKTNQERLDWGPDVGFEQNALKSRSRYNHWQHNAWFDSLDDGSGRPWLRLSDRAINVIAGVQARINELLEGSIVPYRAKVTVDQIGGPPAPQLVLVDPQTGNSGIKPSRLARGFQIWLHLVLLQVSDELRVQNALTSWARGAEAPELAVDDPEEEPSADLRLQLKRVYQSDEYELRPIAFHNIDEIISWISDDDDSLPNNWLSHFRSLRKSRMIVIDEPEQHLHPSLRRRAAKFLGEFADRSGFQVLIATHSAEFLRCSRSQSFTHLSRNEDTGYTTLASIPRESVVRLELENLSSDLGFTRGELLTLCRTILWVEGRDDATVVKNLFAEELFLNGIFVAPMHGRSMKSGLLDATFLNQVVGVPQMVWFDNISGTALERLRSGDVGPDFKTAFETPEEQDAAALVWEAKQLANPTVSVLGHDFPDVWDALDPNCVNDWIKEANPDSKYDHRTFQDDWLAFSNAAKGRGEGKRGKNRKRFLRESLGVDPDFDAVSGMMLARGAITPPFTELLEECSLLALRTDI